MFYSDINCHVFVENKSYTTLSISRAIQAELFKLGLLVISKNLYKFSFTGLLIVNNEIVIVMPKGYLLSEIALTSLKRDIQNLIAVLLKYKNEMLLESEEAMLLGDGGENKNYLHDAYSLMDDYRCHGLLKRELRLSSHKLSNNTHWPNTIRRKTPIFSNGNVIYTDLISRHSINDAENLLLKIQLYVLNFLKDKYGWLLGFDELVLNDRIEELPCEIEWAIQFLNSELRNTYVQREINIIKWLKNILIDIGGKSEKTSFEVLATKTFHNVWEAICACVFDNQYNLFKTILPQPKWDLVDEFVNRHISQRPDIITKYQNNLYVIDAKYYDVSNNLPGWHDAVKQFFYAKSVKKYIENNRGLIESRRADLVHMRLRNIDEVKNIFVLPSYVYSDVKHVGKVSVNGIADFGHVDLVLAPAQKAMSCYLGRDKINFVEILSQKI